MGWSYSRDPLEHTECSIVAQPSPHTPTNLPKSVTEICRDNSSLNFQARQQCLRLKLSPATHVRGAFISFPLMK
jgi:hypothetical protein